MHSQVKEAQTSKLERVTINVEIGLQVSSERKERKGHAHHGDLHGSTCSVFNLF